jgi:hypothetical protein
MNDSIFKIQSIDRKIIHWEDHILDLSPVEEIGGMWFKREDKFAPLGYGGINGSKLRVCIWLISEAIKKGAKGISHGAVTGSPQHPMVACIGSHFNVPVVDCIGTKDPDKHETLKAAKWMGAQFRSFNPGYAATLNAKAAELSKEEFAGYFHLETNITLDERINTAESIEQFHRAGSEQVRNIPDHIETIIIPAGSCNSVTGVMYGIARFRPKGLKRVILMGIGSFGSSDPAYVYRRLRLISTASTCDIKGQNISDLFLWNFDNRIASSWGTTHYAVEQYDVNGGCGHCEKCKDGYVTYNDLMPFKFADLDFHPRYEGKMMNYMQDHIGEFRQYINDKSLFWIVGSKPDASAMVPLLKDRFGDLNV